MYIHHIHSNTTNIKQTHSLVSHVLQIKRIMRPTDIPDTGLLCDLLWADPDKDIVGWGENDRGVSFTFGEDVVGQVHFLTMITKQQTR